MKKLFLSVVPCCKPWLPYPYRTLDICLNAVENLLFRMHGEEILHYVQTIP